MSLIRLLSLFLVIVLTGACSSYSRVSRQPLSRIAETDVQRTDARTARFRSGESIETLRALVESAQAASARFTANLSDADAQDDYNFVVGRIVEAIESSGLEPWNAPVDLGQGQTLAVTVPSLPPSVSLSEFEMTPADRYRFRGTHVENRTLREGVGAPIIAIGRDGDFTERDRFAQGDDIFHGMTALLRFEGPEATLEILEPLDVETVTLGGRRFDLAADFTASMALKLSEINVKKLELARLFKPDQFTDSARLFRLQPYDPDRIPVLFIHGLGNSPATFVPLISELRKDPVLRKKYQFWFFSHPSGVPYSVSTAELRSQLDELGEQFPKTKDMVVIGHSMGGMISRLLITDPGMDLWEAFFDKSPDELPFSDETREAVTRALIFEPRDDIDRVIFVSASLRGSEDATGWLGRLGAKLIGNPFDNDTISRELLAYRRAEIDIGDRQHLPNSVEILDPDSYWLRTVNALPLDASIPFHSLMGDRGQGGNLDRTEPVSSDGIVPYWSAHLEGAESEKVVPSDHWSHLHPEGMAEIRRILRLHLER